MLCCGLTGRASTIHNTSVARLRQWWSGPTGMATWQAGGPLHRLRRELREDVSVDYDDHTQHRGQKDAVHERESEQLRFIARLHIGCGRRDGDVREADHLTHDAAA